MTSFLFMVEVQPTSWISVLGKLSVLNILFAHC
ncbi:hypothetical protein E2I00_013296 [Balaenoptera physalus]|uniref:Uncharacterized protein n=1 Tax=Balaenoptera physalus TaxID=9770 RepID=A0A643BQ34_BALPH|nr:hypothetical protein E2I00_013296 [Balaenoptera physalus]